MDAYEATKIVFSRIQSLDPENAAKIMGVLLVQDHGEKEMIRLAFGPESLIQSVVLNARKDLGLLPPSSPSSILSRQNSARLLPRPPPLAISSPFSWVAPCGEELVDELQHHEPLSFLNEQAGPKSAGDDCHSPMGAEYLPYGLGWAQRYFGPDPTGLGWKPCLYFARGYCKNGSSCRFLHGFPDDSVVATAGKLDAIDHDLLFRSKSQRFMPSAAAALPYSPTGSLPQSPKCMNISFFLQQQSESQRAASATAAAAAALILGGDEAHKFMDRPRMERYDFASVVNPGSRQIYLTFPADSTFREEDVSNYFSIYGPVQDVRIPYQQKRMFGFVTFLYPQTVKLILAKGNPHFVCDARVLVKPYKEKGKVPDKYRKQLGDRGDFSGCTTPTGLDSRDPFDLQQLGARILCASNNQDALLRKKMEEHRELQQTIELQQRRFMDLQLLDLKRNSTAPSTTAVVSPPPFQIPANLEKVSSPRPARTVQEGTSPKGDDDFQERAEHNLPDSPFASPTKLAFPAGDFSSLVAESDNGAVTSSASSALLASSLLPATSTLETMASFKSCFFQIPRFSSGPGAVGL